MLHLKFNLEKGTYNYKYKRVNLPKYNYNSVPFSELVMLLRTHR